MSEINALFTALYSRLAANGTITAALGGSAIFQGIAPDGQALPYLIFSLQSGAMDNICPSELINDVVYIRAFANAFPQAGSIDAMVAADLHDGSISVTGYQNFWLMRESGVALPERGEDGKIIWQAGGMYRVRLSKT